MKGYLRQRGKTSFQLLVHIGTDENGRKQYASRTVHGTKREAQTSLADFVSEVARGGQVPSGPVTIEKVVRDWLRAKSLRLEPTTAERYRVAIDNQIVPRLGSMSIQRLRARHIEDLYAALVKEGLSGSSVRKVHGVLRQALAYAKRRGYVSALATEGVELPPMGAGPISPPETAVLRKILHAAFDADEDFGTLLEFVASSGCRRGEVCGLRWNDLDLIKKSATIRRSISVTPDGLREKVTKTRESRVIALGSATVELLRAHLVRCSDRAAAVERELPKNAHVFSPDPLGENPWHPSTVTNNFEAACKAAGVDAVRLHDLRHHSATTLLKNGASLGEVMDRHGWKSVAMVTRYRHLLDAKDQRAADLLDKALHE